MPTKRNRAGEQQNYVPSGNGDASGEYGDNATGSNIHFTNFKKPEDETEQKIEVEQEETETGGATTEKETKEPIETPIEEPTNEHESGKKILEDLSKTPKQKKEIVSYIYNWTKNGFGLKNERLFENLRYYTGSFGALKDYTDEEIKDLIDYVQEQDFPTDYDNQYYVKSGSKWKITRQKALNDFVGIKTYSKEEMEAIEKAKNEKLVEKSQNEQDKEIQSKFGGNTLVCFGKGYKPEDLKEISEATTNLVNDFDGLKDFVSAMGDRTNLEKYLNARKKSRELTEDEIQAKMEEIKRYTIYYGENKEQRLREDAIRQLSGDVHLTKYRNAYAYWSSSSRLMIFMPRMKNSVESLKNDYESNFHPTDKNISVYYHEMGHATDSMIATFRKKVNDKIKNYEQSNKLHEIDRAYQSRMRELINSNFNENYGVEFANEYNKRYGTNFQNKREIEMYNHGYISWEKEKEVNDTLRAKGINQYNVSKYATTNDGEFLAECFAGHYCNANNPYCEEVFNLTKKYYEQLKELNNEL